VEWFSGSKVVFSPRQKSASEESQLSRNPRNETTDLGRYVPSKGDKRYDQDKVILPPSSIGGSNEVVGGLQIVSSKAV
jgi:hypothetical protein